MKNFLTLALCMAATVAASAQKANVDQASKLSGKSDQLSTARKLINDAIANPETAKDAKTYYVAGKIEFDAFDNDFKTQMINPEAVKGDVMGEKLINGYNFFIKALPLDSLPNEKGQVKPKYSKDIANKLSGHANDYFNAGAAFWGVQNFPKAYEVFVIYAGLPSTGLLGDKPETIIPAEQIATAYYNAGLAAYQAQKFEDAANVFKLARLNNYPEVEAYIYEIASWQAIAGNDEARMNEVQGKIYDAAEAGYEKYGIEQPLFINNIINTLVVEGKTNEAIERLAGIIAANPDNASLIGLRGYVYDRADNDAASEADYRKAASLEGVDFETLKNAAKKIFRIGTKKWDAIEGASAEAAQARKDVKANYFDASKNIVNQARAINADDSELDTLQESIDYVLETYFNN